MKRLLLFTISLLLIVPIVIAIEDSQYVSYKVDEEANLIRTVSNQTDRVLDATCLIDIYNTTNSLVVDDGVMSQTARWYNYTYTFTIEGTWFTEYFCNNSDDSETVVFGEFVSIQPADMTTVNNNLTTIIQDTTILKDNVTTMSAKLNDVYQNGLTIMVNLKNRVYDLFWVDYTPRDVHNVTDSNLATLQNASDILRDTGLILNDTEILKDNSTQILQDTKIIKDNLTQLSIDINNTPMAVWDVNLTNRYNESDDDNFIATLAGEKVSQALWFIIELVFHR